MSADTSALNGDMSEPMEKHLVEDPVEHSNTNGLQVEGDSKAFTEISPGDAIADEPVQENSIQENHTVATEHVTKVEDTQDMNISHVAPLPNGEPETPVPPSVSPSPMDTPAEPTIPISVTFSEAPNYKTKYILSGHRRSISSVKFNPAGTILASAAADKTIKLWDLESAELIKTLEGHSEGISDIAWSRDGDYLASASDDKTIWIWNMETLAMAKVLKGHTNFVFCVNFSPSANMIVSGGFDETVRVWDVARAKTLKTLPAHSDPVTAVTFNHDGTLIASCAMDGLIRVWDTESGQCLKTLADDDNPICSHIKFTPNSKFILASTQDSTIRLWNIQTSRCVKTYTGHTNRTYSIFADLAPGAKHVVSGSEDYKIYLWNLQKRQIVQVLEGHRDVVIAIASHPNRPIIASAAMEKDLTIRIWYDSNA